MNDDPKPLFVFQGKVLKLTLSACLNVMPIPRPQASNVDPKGDFWSCGDSLRCLWWI